MQKSLIIGNFESWIAEALRKGEEARPLNARETLRFVWAYIRAGKGLSIKRCISSLKRLAANSLKPSQVSLSGNA